MSEVTTTLESTLNQNAELYHNCFCGCGKTTNLGKKFISGHNSKNHSHVQGMHWKQRRTIEREKLTKDLPLPLCLCGCGSVLKLEKRFVHGHNSKLQQKNVYPTKFCPNCGISFNTERIYCSAKCYHTFAKGKPNGCKKNKIISPKKQRIPWNKGKKGIEAWNKGLNGIHLSPNSEWKKGSIPWNKGLTKEECPNLSKSGMRSELYTNETRQKIRNNRLKQVIPFKDTSIEITLQKELTKRGIAFVKHPAIKICQPDLYLPDYDVVIFADGCYWHACSVHYPNSPYGEWKTHDKAVTIYLTKMGYKVFRFWEHEIKKSPEKCIDKILQLSKIIISEVKNYV